VHQGEQVQVGSTLIILRDSDLNLEFSRVHGEIQTAQKRLAVIQSARLELNATDANALQQANRLTAEQEELNERLKKPERTTCLTQRPAGRLDPQKPPGRRSADLGFSGKTPGPTSTARPAISNGR